MKNLAKYILLISFASVQFTAANGGGSLYSRYGIGDIYYNYSARGIGLGAVGVTLAKKNFLSAYNPAGWHSLQQTYFETGMHFKGLNIGDNNSSALYDDFKFSGVIFGFPISKDNGISFVMGIVPYSLVRYSVVEQVDNPPVDPYSINYSGDGGMSRLFVGTSYETPLGISIGATFDYYSGKIGYESEFDFSLSSDFRDSKYRRELNYHGLGANIGLISNDFSKMLGIDFISDWRFGATLSIIGKLPTDKILFGSSSIGTAEIAGEIVDTEIPPRIAGGTSFKTGNTTVLLDYVYQPWSEYKFENQASKYLRDAHRIGVGLEYHPGESRLASFWEQVSLRGGLTYEQTQYQINGIGIDSYSVSLGVTLPFQLTNSIDIGLRAGIRGSYESNLVKEKFFISSFSINLGELWFVREER